MSNYRVWDTFLFRNELDLLEARLTELNSAVYRHILVESPVTFSGDAKPLYYLENQERFAPWKDKIIHVTADLSDCMDCWGREMVSREAITQGLTDLEDEDIFLISDVDEIPMADMIQESRGNIFIMRQHVLAVNLLDAGWWAGTLSVRGKDHLYAIKRFLDRQKGLLYPFLKNSIGFPVITGWHFTWLGGPQEVQAKANALDQNEIPRVKQSLIANAYHEYRNKINPVTGGRLLEVVIDKTFPRYMQEHKGPANWYWS